MDMYTGWLLDVGIALAWLVALACFALIALAAMDGRSEGRAVRDQSFEP
jgi:hypothetical protein